MAVNFGRQQRQQYQVAPNNGVDALRLMAKSMDAATKTVDTIGKQIATKKTLEYLDQLQGEDRTAENILKVTQGANLTPTARAQIQDLIRSKRAEEASALQNQRQIARDKTLFDYSMIKQNDQQAFSSSENSKSRALQRELESSRQARRARDKAERKAEREAANLAKGQQAARNLADQLKIGKELTTLKHENEKSLEVMNSENATPKEKLIAKTRMKQNDFKKNRLNTALNSLINRNYGFTAGDRMSRTTAYPQVGE